MGDFPLKQMEWNEIQIVASPTTWTVEVALIPRSDYPDGKWKQVYGRKQQRPCKGSTHTCVMRMAIEGLISLEEELREEWFDPKVFAIRILVGDLKAANIMRRKEVDMVSAKLLNQLTMATKPFKSYSVWRIADTNTTNPSHERNTRT